MESYLNDRFLKTFRLLPNHVRREARQAYKLFKNDPYHPSLHFKKVGKNHPIYSARVTLNYRVLGIFEDNVITWFWIGTHDEYEKLLKGL
jgi:hypothetical protein